MKQLSSNRCFNGEQRIYEHESSVIGLPMKFGVYLPPQALKGESETQKCKALFYLAGLTCTEETFAIKAGAQRLAAELGLALLTPDTSPRAAQVPGEADAWDFGVGSGGSPMVNGHSTANAALEADLAQFVQLPRALYFYAGFATNASVIPALVAGSALAGAISMAAGCELRVPHGGVFVLPIPNAVTNLGMYLVALAAGTALTAVALGFVTRSMRAAVAR